ncbi:TPA: ATP-grasp domain-containing protein [Morganella morganii]
MMENKYVLIVDPFSSGAVFANRIRMLFGYDVVALITNQALPSAVMATFRQEDYSAVFSYHSLGRTVQDIESVIGRAPDFIVCGSEPGVLIFDKLCYHWGLRPNVPARSTARRDKYRMQQQLMLDGIRCIPHYQSGDLAHILHWCKENPFDEYVIKPVNSFGTDGVLFCKNTAEITRAFHSLINTTDYAGNNNTVVLVEQKIHGTEYVADAVSCDGNHFIVNIFRYVKQEINGVPVYHQMVTEPVDEHPVLISYVKEVLDSLGIRNGASHNEVIMSDGGPVLVESGARMHGGLGPQLAEECNSHSLIDLSLLARIAPHEFENKIQTPPVLKKYAAEYFLSSPQSGVLNTLNIESQCSFLESYGFCVCKYRPGDWLEKTTDLVTSYGRIVLFNSDKTKLIADVRVITELEKKGMLMTLRYPPA